MCASVRAAARQALRRRERYDASNTCVKMHMSGNNLRHRLRARPPTNACAVLRSRLRVLSPPPHKVSRSVSAARARIRHLIFAQFVLTRFPKIKMVQFFCRATCANTPARERVSAARERRSGAPQRARPAAGRCADDGCAAAADRAPEAAIPPGAAQRGAPDPDPTPT